MESENFQILNKNSEPKIPVNDIEITSQVLIISSDIFNIYVDHIV